MTTRAASPWSQQKERGSPLLARFMIWLTLRLGWSVGRALLLPITLYFVIMAAGPRAASRQYLRRVLARSPTWLEVFRHFHVFASVILERVLLLNGQYHRFDFNLIGLEHLKALVEQGRGCVLLGAHLGSFEALRAIGTYAPVSVRALMYRRNLGRFTDILERLNPALAGEIIEIGTPNAMLEARDCVDRGEFIGILADRAPDGMPHGQKFIRTSFLGGPASFPVGPIILAAAVGAPTLLCFGVRTGKCRYTIRFEPFADPLVIRREQRQPDLAQWVGRFAARLEAEARAHPFNWFNFYDFWKEPADAATATPDPDRARARAPLEPALVVSRDGVHDC